MTNVTFNELPAGNADLHLAGKVEPFRQGTAPWPAPLTTQVVAAGAATFDLTPRIEYVVRDASGRFFSAMLSTTRGGS